MHQFIYHKNVVRWTFTSSLQDKYVPVGLFRPHESRANLLLAARILINKDDYCSFTLTNHSG